MKNLSLTKISSKKIRKKFLKFKHGVKRERYFWKLKLISLSAKLGFAKKCHSWEEFEEYINR